MPRVPGCEKQILILRLSVTILAGFHSYGLCLLSQDHDNISVAKSEFLAIVPVVMIIITVSTDQYFSESVDRWGFCQDTRPEIPGRYRILVFPETQLPVTGVLFGTGKFGIDTMRPVVPCISIPC